MNNLEILIQQLITGLSNGMIIALIALGYTMVYGIIELINFAHGDLFMLGSFLALTVLGACGLALPTDAQSNYSSLLLLLAIVPLFCAALNWCVYQFAYRPLGADSRLAPLVTAIGVSFIFLNMGLFWGGLPLEVFNFGHSAASPKDFPSLVSQDSLITGSQIYISAKDLLVVSITIPLMLLLTFFVKKTKTGRAMRAVAQNPTAAKLMGISVERIIAITFVIGGLLAGTASVIYATYNNTIYYQMGFRVGTDAFTAAVLGGIGNIPGAILGGILIGVLRSISDQYLASQWTNLMVFVVLVLVLIFRPSGILGARVPDKV